MEARGAGTRLDKLSSAKGIETADFVKNITSMQQERTFTHLPFKDSLVHTRYRGITIRGLEVKGQFRGITNKMLSSLMQLPETKPKEVQQQRHARP